jgi:hypothetical protein
MDNIPLTGQSPTEHTRGYLKENFERIAYYILLAWCMLPIIMCIDYVICGMLGKYPSAEKTLSMGLTPGYVNYGLALRSYQILFFVLGAVTFCFALLGVLYSRRRLFSLLSIPTTSVSLYP